jgi:hypothetical protein
MCANCKTLFLFFICVLLSFFSSYVERRKMPLVGDITLCEYFMSINIMVTTCFFTNLSLALTFRIFKMPRYLCRSVKMYVNECDTLCGELKLQDYCRKIVCIILFYSICKYFLETTLKTFTLVFKKIEYIL